MTIYVVWYYFNMQEPEVYTDAEEAIDAAGDNPFVAQIVKQFISTNDKKGQQLVEYKVILSHDLTDDIIVASLVEQIHNLSDPKDDKFETPANKVHNLSALLKTLEYYTNKEDFTILTKDLKIKLNPSKRGSKK